MVIAEWNEYRQEEHKGTLMLYFPKTFWGQFMKGLFIGNIIAVPLWVILILWGTC